MPDGKGRSSDVILTFISNSFDMTFSKTEKSPFSISSLLSYGKIQEKSN